VVLELMACMMLAGSTAGLLGTFLTWMSLDGRRLRQFAQRLALEGPWRVTRIHTEDTTTPLTVDLWSEDDATVVTLTVASHGAHATWRVEAALEGIQVPGIIEILDERWARATVDLHRRATVEWALGWRERPYRVVAGGDGSAVDAQGWLRQAGLGPVLEFSASELGLGAVRIEAGRVEMELERSGLDVSEAFRAVDAVLRVLHAVQGRAHVPVVADAAAEARDAGHTVSGAPTAVFRR
jgi:hypothetical protein